MSDALDLARKQCPQCGHANRLAAKICSNCGYAFPANSFATPEPAKVEGVPLKRCPECAHENRLSAKVCTQCGHKFRSMQSQGQKWCPRCGSVNRLEAKVCTNCGHKFRTNFAKSAAPAAQKPAAPSVLSEAPITQSPAAPVALPVQFEPPPRLPDLPDLPRAPKMPNPTPVDVPDDPSDPGDPGDLYGVPAPDLTDLDFDTLRRGKPDHAEGIDAAGRAIISLFNKNGNKKDRNRS